MVALLVALTFIGFLVIDVVVRKVAARKAVELVPQASLAGPRPAFPLGYFVSPGHIWMNLMPSGRLKVGWDELVQRFLGGHSRVMLKKPGDTVAKGEPLAVLTKGGNEINVLSPVAGRIEETNTMLEEHPDELAKNPYEAGWFYQIRPFQLADDLSGMKVADQAKTWLSDELQRLKDFVMTSHPQLAPTLADGGALVEGAVDYLDKESVERFQRQFLMNTQEIN